jgi:DNA-binding FadR family transcriptional regulator
MDDEAQGALIQLRAYLTQQELPANARLPPERELCEILGVSRGELRKALAILEGHGEVWRHVGKGTFIGARPGDEFANIAEIAQASNPRDVMHARLLIEPLLAAEAALGASASEIAEMRDCLAASREARTWRHYENFDNRLHRLIAGASRNTLLLALFDTLNAVRRTVVWGRLRDAADRPPADHHSFLEHERIVQCINDRDIEGARTAMHAHLTTVSRNLLAVRQAAE